MRRCSALRTSGGPSGGGDFLVEANATIDPRRLRGILAEAQVSHSAYARACRLSRVYVSGILSGRVQPGELSRIKMVRGLTAFGISLAEKADEEVPHAR